MASSCGRMYFVDLATRAELSEHPLNGAAWEGCGRSVDWPDRRLKARHEVWVFQGRKRVKVTADDFGGKAVGVKLWFPNADAREKFFLVPRRCAWCDRDDIVAEVDGKLACEAHAEYYASTGEVPPMPADLHNEDLPPQMAPKRPDPPEGVHLVDETVYRVVRGRQSGRLYAKRLVPVEHGKADWEYEGRRPFRKLSEATLIGDEEAREFGARFGVCCVCAKTLTAGLSVDLGIGPVCGKRIHQQEKARRRAAAA
jgi:uncharacterized protein DUF6011